jgi:hypothetical protein
MAPQFWQTIINTLTGALLEDDFRSHVSVCTSTSHCERKRPHTGQPVMCFPNRKRSISAFEISRAGAAVSVIALTVT